LKRSFKADSEIRTNVYLNTCYYVVRF